MSIKETINTDTVICLADAPSVTNEQLDMIRGFSDHIITVNRSCFDMPSAAIHFGGDRNFWNNFHDEISKRCNGNLVTIKGSNKRITEIPFEFGSGISLNHIIHNSNSGFQAINLACLLGAKNIILVGYDFKYSDDGKCHRNGAYDKKKFAVNFVPLEKHFKIAEVINSDLRRLGIRIVNCSLNSDLCFIKKQLKNELYYAKFKTIDSDAINIIR